MRYTLQWTSGNKPTGDHISSPLSYFFYFSTYSHHQIPENIPCFIEDNYKIWQKCQLEKGMGCALGWQFPRIIRLSNAVKGTGGLYIKEGVVKVFVGFL